MRKSLIIFVALAMVVAFAVPTMAAGLKVTGRYADNYIIYEKGVISFEPGNLYLNFEFKEGTPIVAFIKTKFDLKSGGAFGAGDSWNVWKPDYTQFWIEKGSYIAYTGAPLVISLARRDAPGTYTLADPGDPLGMARMDRYQALGKTENDAIFKVAGKIQNVGITAMMTHDFAGTPDTTHRDYAVLRLTTEAVPGYKVGATYATKANGASNTVANFGVDLSGGLPLGQGATMNLAIGQSRSQVGDGWQEGQNAYWFGASGYKIGGVTLSGDFRAVDPDFAEVFPMEADPKSLVYGYKGQRQIFGKVATDLNLGGQKGTLTVSNDYRVNFDGSKNVVGGFKPTNTLAADYTFSPVKDLTLVLGGSYAKCLSNEANYNDDAATELYAKLNSYKIAPMVLVEGSTAWRREDRFMAPNDVAGAGTKLEGKVTVTPIAGVKLEGNAKYSAGTYDFFDNKPLTAAKSRLDVWGYGEAKQSLSAPGVKKADTILAGKTYFKEVGTGNYKLDYAAGYGEANLQITDKLSNRNAVLFGTTETGRAEMDYKQILYTGLDYKVSDNSTLTLAYCKRENPTGTPVGNVYGAYTIQLGGSKVVLSYGENRLTSADGDAVNGGTPWAWLSTIGSNGTRPLYKLTVEIPF